MPARYGYSEVLSAKVSYFYDWCKRIESQERILSDNYVKTIEQYGFLKAEERIIRRSNYPFYQTEKLPIG